MLKYLKYLFQGMLVQATSNLLAGIQPTITTANQKFFGSNRPDSGCIHSDEHTDSDLAFQTWEFNLESAADINTVSILFEDMPKLPQRFEVRVGFSSDIYSNPICAVSETPHALEPTKTWLRCGLRGNFMSVTLCGQD